MQELDDDATVGDRAVQQAASYKHRADSAFESGDLALAIDLYKRAIADIKPSIALSSSSSSSSEHTPSSHLVDLYTKCRLNAIAVLFHRRDWPACAQEGREAGIDDLCRYSTHQLGRLMYYTCVGMMKSCDVSSLATCRVQFEKLRDLTASPDAKSDFSAQEIHEFEQIGPALLSLELSTLKKFVSRCKQFFANAYVGASPASTTTTTSGQNDDNSNKSSMRLADSPELVHVLLEASEAFAASVPYLPSPYPAVLEACRAHLLSLAKQYDQACGLYFKLATDASLSRVYRDSLLLMAAVASQYCRNLDMRRKGLRALRDLTVPTASDEIGGMGTSGGGAVPETEKKRQVHQRYILDAIQAYASVTYGIMKLETVQEGAVSGSKAALDCFLDALGGLSAYFDCSRNISFWQMRHLAVPFRWDAVCAAPVDEASAMPEFDEFCKLSGYFNILPDGFSVFVAAVAGITRAVGVISDASKTVSTAAHVSKLISDVLKRFNFNAFIGQMELQSRLSYVGCFGSSAPILDTLNSICVVMKFLFDSKKSLGVIGYHNTIERLRDIGALISTIGNRLAKSSHDSTSFLDDPNAIFLQAKCSRLCNRLLDLQFEFCTWMLGCMNVKPFVVCEGANVQDACTLDKHSTISIDLPTDIQVILLDCSTTLSLVENNALSLYSYSRDLYFSYQSADRVYCLRDEVVRSFDTDTLKRGLHGVISTSCLRLLSLRIQALYNSSLASWRLDLRNQESGKQKLEAVMSCLERSVDAHREYDAIIECISSNKLIPKSELRKDSKGYHVVVSDIYFHLAKAYDQTRRFELASEAAESCLCRLSDVETTEADPDLGRIRKRQVWILKAMLCRGNKTAADECIRNVRSLCIPPSEDPDDHEQRLLLHLNARYPGLYTTPKSRSNASSGAASSPVPKTREEEIHKPPKDVGFRFRSLLERLKAVYWSYYSEADKDLLFAYGVLTTASAILVYFVITVYFVKREY